MKKTLSFISGLLLIINAYATHIVGGQIEVKWLSGNDYEIRLNFYRNCTPGTGTGGGDPTPFPPSVNVCIYDKVTNVFYKTSAMSHISTTPLVLGDSCYTPPGCVELGVYTATVTIDNNPNGYYLYIPWGNRNSGITNVVAGGVTYYAEIPDPSLHNSSPVFNNYPKAYFCLQFPNTEDLSASDVNGDSLYYSLTDPLSATADVNGNWPCNAAPYTKGPYNSPYSFADILGAGSTISINPHTGFLNVNPAFMGLYVLSIKVEEFRHGVKLGEVNRDIQYNILQCATNVPPVFNESPSDNSMTVIAGEDLCFDLKLNDANADWIVINAISHEMLSGNTDNPIMHFTKDSVLSPDSANVHVCIETSCSNVRPAPYHVRFYGADTSCYGRNVVNKDYDIYVVPTPMADLFPNVFTPNGDDVNDYFKLNAASNACYDKFNIKIYNRWGKLEYESNDFMFKWDGKNMHNASKSPEGTYYYIINSSFQDQQSNGKGYVEIIR